MREGLPSPTVSHQQSGTGPGATHTCGYPGLLLGSSLWSQSRRDSLLPASQLIPALP